MADGVVHPRHRVAVVVDLLRVLEDAVADYGVPPADLHGGSADVAVDHGGHVGHEAGGQLLHVLRLGCAGERGKRIVLYQLGRKHLAVGVGIVAARAARILQIRGHAHLGNLVDCVARTEVGLNLRRRPRAVPDAHFVERAFVEIGRDVVPRNRLGGLLRTEGGGSARAAAQHGCGGNGMVGHHREVRRRVGLRILHNAGYAVGRYERRLLGGDFGAVHVYLKLGAVEGGGDMGPCGVGEIRTLDVHATVGGVVELGERPAVGGEADREVVADHRHRVGEIPAGVVRRTRNGVLRRARRGGFGPQPRLDRELLEEVCVARVVLARRRRVGYCDALRTLAAERDALAAGRIEEVLRVARRLDHALLLGAVGLPVGVCVVAFVDLECVRVRRRPAVAGVVFGVAGILRRTGPWREVVLGDVRRRAVDRHPAVRHRILDYIAHDNPLVVRQLEHGAVGECNGGYHDRVGVRLAGRDRYLSFGDGRVGHPQRSRVGMCRARSREVGEQSLFLVPYAIAVGVARSGAHHPRIAHGIVGQRFVVLPADETVAIGVDAAAVRFGDHVGGVLDGHHLQHSERCGKLADAEFANLAENRVEAVEQFVEVVHAVGIAIPQTRIGRHVAGRPDPLVCHRLYGRNRSRQVVVVGDSACLVPDCEHRVRYGCLPERGVRVGNLRVVVVNDLVGGIGRWDDFHRLFDRIVLVGVLGACPFDVAVLVGVVVDIARYRTLAQGMRRQHVLVAEVDVHRIPFPGRIGEVAELRYVVGVLGCEVGEVVVAEQQLHRFERAGGIAVLQVWLDVAPRAVEFRNRLAVVAHNRHVVAV